jgi:hypothetical protein
MARRNVGPWFRASRNLWYATVDGKAVPLNVAGRNNEAAAIAAWHRLMAGVAPTPPQPTAPPQPAVPSNGAAQRPAPTAAELFDAFLADVRGRSAGRTGVVYAFVFRHFKAAFGNRPAASIRPHDVEAAARRPSWSSSTRNSSIGAAVSAFRWGERVGLLASNPLRAVRKPPKTSRGAKSIVTPAQHAALCGVAPAPFRQFLRGLWLTGCRPGERPR